MSLSPFIYVDTPELWSACLARISTEPRVAVDLEANSLYAYREEICLIQISIPDADYIVDPLGGFALEGLDVFLANVHIEKVFHACEYDLILLKRQWDYDVRNLFDTMWAARVLGYTNMGLAWFLRELYSVELTKKHQKANWGARPLSPEQLAYAQMDTHYLLQLREEFGRRLEAEGHLKEALEIFKNESAVRVPQRVFTADDFWRINGVRDLKPKQQAVLKALFIYRDEEAKRRNQPPFKVLSNQILLAVAHAMPRSREELAKISALPERLRQRLAPQLLRAVQDGLAAPHPAKPQRGKRHAPDVAERYDRLFQWRREYAQSRGVESDVVLSRNTIWMIAHANPKSMDELSQVPTLGPRRLEMYGEEILRQLVSTHPVQGTD